MKLKIAICDDNEQILNEEYNMLEFILKERCIEGVVHKFSEPEELLKSTEIYDIVVLDVEMGRLNGIETADMLKKANKECIIFFVTNYESYIDEAFNKHPFRFWTKPLDKRRLDYGVECALKEINARIPRINVHIDNTNLDVPAGNIIYIYMENRRLHLITDKGDMVTRDTIKSIGEQLKDIGCFGKTSRGYYVNFNYVTEYDREYVYCEYQQKKYKVDISRRKYNDFNISFKKWLGGAK
jgi:DNA-binding LytR/AlgR family response regulator